MNLGEIVRAFSIDGAKFMLHNREDIDDFDAIKDEYPTSRSSKKIVGTGKDAHEVVVQTFSSDVTPKLMRSRINEMRQQRRKTQGN